MASNKENIKTLKRKKILILDDDLGILDVLRLIFEDNYEVKILQNSKLLFNVLTAFNPDLLLIDQILSEQLTGIDICDRLANTARFATTPIILLSASHLKDKRSIHKNCIFTEKPFDIDELQQLVEKLISGSCL